MNQGWGGRNIQIGMNLRHQCFSTLNKGIFAILKYLVTYLLLKIKFFIGLLSNVHD